MAIVLHKIEVEDALEDDLEEEYDAQESLYPSSDGKPMGETDTHVDLTLYFKFALMRHFIDRPDVYVAANNFIYYEEGNPKANVSPDGYVVFGAGMRQRRAYLAWEESGLLPDVVFEFTSKKTRKQDWNAKKTLYEKVFRAAEYFIFNPTLKRDKNRLNGFRLVDGAYVPLKPINYRMYSEQLRLELVQERDNLYLYDPFTETRLPTPLEAIDEAMKAMYRAEEAAEQAEAAEERAEQEARRADAEAQRAETESRRAETQARRAETAEAELARLRAELERRQKQG